MKGKRAIAQLYTALDVTRSGYHAWQQAAPSARNQRDDDLSEDLATPYSQHRGRHGTAHLSHTARRRGLMLRQSRGDVPPLQSSSHALAPIPTAGGASNTP